MDRDTVLHHVVVGSGPAVTFFLHGFLGSGRNLSALVRRYTDARPDVRAVQVDLPGHGRSPPLPPRADLNTAARQLLALADQLEVERFDIVGHSLGGRVGLALVGEAADRVNHVDILDITPGSTHHLPVGHVINPLLAAPEDTPDRRAMHRFFVESGLTAAFTDWLLMNLERDGDRFRWRIDRPRLAEFHQRHGNADLWSIVEGHPTKIRALRGSDSKYLSDEDVSRLQRLGIEVLTVAGAGHFLHADNLDGTFEAMMKPRG